MNIMHKGIYIVPVIGLYICMTTNKYAILSELSKNSYGIYLFHSPLV